MKKKKYTDQADEALKNFLKDMSDENIENLLKKSLKKARNPDLIQKIESNLREMMNSHKKLNQQLENLSKGESITDDEFCDIAEKLYYAKHYETKCLEYSSEMLVLMDFICEGLKIVSSNTADLEKFLEELDY